MSKPRQPKDVQAIKDQSDLIAQMAAHNCVLRDALLKVSGLVQVPEAKNIIDDAIDRLEREPIEAIVIAAAHIILPKLAAGEPGSVYQALSVALKRILDHMAHAAQRG